MGSTLHSTPSAVENQMFSYKSVSLSKSVFLLTRSRLSCVFIYAAMAFTHTHTLRRIYALEKKRDLLCLHTYTHTFFPTKQNSAFFILFSDYYWCAHAVIQYYIYHFSYYIFFDLLFLPMLLFSESYSSPPFFSLAGRTNCENMATAHCIA